MPFLLVILFAYLCGSLPFSVWLSKLFLHRDARHYGDGNPGAVNAFRAGKLVGLLVLVLDISKGAVPVGLAYHNLGYRGLLMWATATAPVLGHAFSPFLGFSGGKAIAVSFGVWIGLTLWVMPLPAVLLVLFGTALLDVAGWALMLTLAGMLVVLLVWIPPGTPDPLYLAVWAGQAALLAWTHRADLRRRPHLRAWLTRRVR